MRFVQLRAGIGIKIGVIVFVQGDQRRQRLFVCV